MSQTAVFLTFPSGPSGIRGFNESMVVRLCVSGEAGGVEIFSTPSQHGGPRKALWDSPEFFQNTRDLVMFSKDSFPRWFSNTSSHLGLEPSTCSNFKTRKSKAPRKEVFCLDHSPKSVLFITCSTWWEYILVQLFKGSLSYLLKLDVHVC